MNSDIAVVRVGMITSVGLSAAETAASVRAGIARFGESDFLDRGLEPVILASVPDEGLGPVPVTSSTALDAESTSSWNDAPLEARLLRLASLALGECLDGLPVGVQVTSLFLALPATRDGGLMDRTEFMVALGNEVNRQFEPSRSDAAFDGRAGGLIAIGRAIECIRTGTSEFVVAGGVDCYRDIPLVVNLDLEGRVKSSTNMDGFIPGEGAAFLLLSSTTVASSLGLKPIALISDVTEAHEAGHLYSEEPYRCDGLADTLRILCELYPGAPIMEVFSSMNGENHWAKEWGVAYIRNSRAFGEDFRFHHPAECYGDPGAAAGPLLACITAMGIRDKYRRSPALVYASSDHGQRAALFVRQP